MQYLNASQPKIQNRIEKLNNVRDTLKKEFFGIDEVIDRIIDLISSWYAIPEIQTKPFVINLWGMTGIGKTSLIDRMMQLLELKDSFFSFDLGERSRSSFRTLRDKLENIYKVRMHQQLVLSFDEFQYAKTINEESHEIIDSESRIIWEILGSGKFTIPIDYHDVHEIYRYNKFLQGRIKQNRVGNSPYINIPESEWRNIHDMEGYAYESLNQGPTLFSSIYLDPLHEIVGKDLYSRMELIDIILESNPEELIFKIFEWIRNLNFHRTVDCSRALIFIVGNLDEAYNVSGSLNPDIGADIFYEATKKISITKVKKVLQGRFRNEQIARLGNNHIIYPSLSSEAFRKIIDFELKKIPRKIRRVIPVDIEFDQSLKDLVYKEGVFPAQGVRPIHTTIDNLVGSNISKILYHGIINEIDFDKIILGASDLNLAIDFVKHDKIEATQIIALSLQIENRRYIRNAELQTVVAVHESGHAILSSLQLNDLPENIVSVSADDQSNGITTYNNTSAHKLLIKEDIIKLTAFNLGGYAAEKVIFGENKVTGGSSFDIDDATEFVSRMIKKAGLGSQLGNFGTINPKDALMLSDHKAELNQEIKALLLKAMELAETTLSDNIKLLVKCAEYLSKNSFMSKEKFKEYLEKFATYELNTEQNNGYYGKCLQQKISEVEQCVLNFTGTDD